MSATEFKQQFQSDPHEYIASHTLQFHVVVDGQCGKVASSGAIISVDGKRYVVTVLHGLSENVGMLCIERKSNRTLIVKPEKYPVITSNKLMDDGKRGDPLVDFTFFPLSDDYIPIRKVRFECPDRTRCFRIKELPVCKINALPKEADYSLGGSIPNSDSDADSFALFAEITGLSPIKITSQSYLYFSTANATIDSRVEYEGLSGAPIFNGDGVPVALLNGPCDEDEKGNKIQRQLWGTVINEVVGIIRSVENQTMPKFTTLSEEERLCIAKRALDLGSPFYDDQEIKDMLWQQSTSRE